MATYKTPGVYVEEITKLPPSVAEVDTAIPAFVGYTEKAKRFVENDLIKVPTRIKSLLEYEQYFGVGPSYTSIHVQLNTQNIVDEEKTTVANSIYNLYESMRLFYDNGGGVCYVCSVGKYSNAHNDTDRAANITAGLAEIRKFDEPTLLLFPDAANLKTGGNPDWDKIASIQQAALKQCGDMGDRFAILDVVDASNKTPEEEAELFRSKVGMNNLKYGAAYSPFIKTTYDKTFKLRDIAKNFFDSGNNPIKLKSLFANDAAGIAVKTKLDDFEKTYTDTSNISGKLSVFSGRPEAEPFNSANLDTTYQSLIATYNAAATDDDRIDALKPAFEFVFKCFLQLEGLMAEHPAQSDPPNAGQPIRTITIKSAGLKSSVESLLTGNLKPVVQKFRDLDNEGYRKVGAEISDTELPAIDFSLITGAWAPGAASDLNLLDGTTTEKLNKALSELGKIYESAKAGLNSAVSIAAAFEEASEKALIPDLPIYNSVLRVLNNKVNTLPPSGAIAGIYAAVDRTRGVWKAPANVTINSVSDVSELIDDVTQEGLNVDPNAGKSINAIRPFYGKGIMVWGSRTLAGNDNEWRYIPVRRLFNFVEESCKKSTSWCVFEPNDANSWARIRGQIDNFLNNLWRAGALAGAKPEHAYFVNCGIGITMTAQDILEGRLIVEIGMAAVRPAEFVILKFSHKLQQS